VSHVWLSAAKADGLDLLRESVAERLARVARRATLRLPVSAGELRARLYAANLVLAERIADDGAFEIDTELSEFELLKWAREPGVEVLSIVDDSTCTAASAYLQSSPALRSS
jgi:GTP-binding protein HflX